METSEPSSSSAPLAAAADDYPRWVLLDTGLHSWKNRRPISIDAKTAAHARTSTGLRVRASFHLAAPPAMSHLILKFDGGLSDTVAIYYNVVAAHGDFVLVCVSMPDRQGRYTDKKSASVWRMRDGTGIMLLGDDEEFVVATNLTMSIVGCKDGGGVKRAAAEFHLLRSSDLQWKTQRLPVQGKVSFNWWETDMAIPVAGRFFYWVDLHEGIVISDVREQSPELRFVPLPADPLRRERNEVGSPDSSRNLCAIDGGATVKFILVSPRCCCGCPAVTTCAFSLHAFNVTTWTLRSTQAGGMVWEKDGVVDSGDHCTLGTYQCLPRLLVANPDIIYLLVSKRMRHSGEIKMVSSMVTIDMKTKSLVGSAPILSTEQHYRLGAILLSQVSNYFNTSPGRRNHTPPASERRGRKDIAVQRATDLVASSNQEILAALHKIPGLARDEMMRVYGVLACNDHRRYQSLVALPMDMRKDYCCMLVDMGTNKQTE
ncbi:unnamed protein product [Alopecurus aequalis]